MNYRKLTRRLRQLGCEFVRQASGSHEVWWNPAKQQFTVIPRHDGRDLPAGTQRAILRLDGMVRVQLAARRARDWALPAEPERRGRSKLFKTLRLPTVAVTKL